MDLFYAPRFLPRDTMLVRYMPSSV